MCSAVGTMNRSESVNYKTVIEVGRNVKFSTVLSICASDPIPSDSSGYGSESESEEADSLAPLWCFYESRFYRRREYDLEQKIALEIKMREGTTKLLTAVGSRQLNQPHTLEAAKSLLTSNARVSAYMGELHGRLGNRKAQDSSPTQETARVCLSDLRIPLVWKDFEHFKNKGDLRKFAVFVLLKIGTEIYDTVMVNPVDRTMTDICFDDIIVFNGISADFEFVMEVYSYAFENEFSVSSIPRKLKKTLHSSISRTVGRKLAATLSDDLSSEVGPKFELVATSKLDLSHLSNNISTYDLHLENTENRPNTLPLFGHFCCRLAAQPNCFTRDKICGYANVKECGFTKDAYCRILGWRMEVWESKEEAETSSDHPLALSIDSNTQIKQLSKWSFQLSNKTGIERGTLNCTFRHPDDQKLWTKTIKRHIIDYQRWGRIAEDEMEILTPQPSRHSFAKKNKFTSLYEETPLGDGSASEKSSYDDLSSTSSSTYLNTFTPAPLSTRSRFPRSSFRRFGSVRANMPFFRTKS